LNLHFSSCPRQAQVVEGNLIAKGDVCDGWTSWFDRFDDRDWISVEAEHLGAQMRE
jgi:hypothetical protein